jgi:hypothetical protein
MLGNILKSLVKFKVECIGVDWVLCEYHAAACLKVSAVRQQYVNVL